MPLHISPEEIGSIDFILERQQHYLREKQAYAKKMADEAAAKAKALLGADAAARQARKPPSDMTRSEQRRRQKALERTMRIEDAHVQPGPQTIHSIVAYVGSAFGKTFEEMVSSRREAHYVIPRHIAMYLCRKRLVAKSLPQIARVFRRDHTTVLYGTRKIEEMLADNKEVRERVSQIEGMMS